MMKCTQNIYKPSFIIILIFTLLMVNSPSVTAEEASSAKYPVAEEAMELIEQYYIYPMNEEYMEDFLLKGIANTLPDPYSNYFTKEEYAYITEEAFVDIGIEVKVDRAAKTVKIIHIYEGSPAEKAGLKEGDVILTVDGDPVDTADIYAMAYLFAGEKGTTAIVQVKRQGNLKTLRVIRDTIEQRYLYSQMLDEQIGYIQLLEFMDQSGDMFKDHLTLLKEQGMEKLVLDLRYNQGGYIHVLDEIAKQLWDRTLLMHTTDRTGYTRPHVILGGTELDIPIVVLVNDFSASASEILAGALQDHGKAQIIGTPTYGKARMQHVFQLSNEGMLIFTTDAYLTPNKHDIEGVGLVPDIYEEDELAQLVKGLHTLGTQTITLEDYSDYVIVNGLKVLHESAVTVFKDKLYVETSLLSTLAPVSFQHTSTDTKRTIVHGNTSKTIDQQKGHFITKNGETYVHAEILETILPNLDVFLENGKPVLHYAY
ncbi:S41 family peptidase [Marinicrinis sediminis]|uniref:S41 family peptidase n=1 Tax=Marinicrinis sediminis TaxID=1652465 RepID=A0ABW5RCT3_9BACL